MARTTPSGAPAPPLDPNALPDYVPASWRTLIKWAAGVVGIPVGVVAAQINLESSFNDNAVSPTGAQGPAQFEPGTWQSEGCHGSPFDRNSAMKCYAKLMYSLVKQYKGSIRDALAAYNAGEDPAHPGQPNPAGFGYADEILQNAGEPQGGTATTGTGKSSTTPTTSQGQGAGDQSNCLLNLLPIPTTSGWCPLTKIDGRILVAVSLVIGAAMLGLAGFRMAAEREGIIGGGKPGPVGKAVRGVAMAAAPEAAVAGKVASTVSGRRAAAGRREEQELRASGASELSSARRPIRQEIRAGQRPAVRSGRRTGTLPGPAARQESPRARAARTASTGRRPATRAETGF